MPSSWLRSLPFVLAASGAGILILTGTAKGAEPVVIRNLDKPGKFEVENTGPDISLRTRLEVQKHRDGAWIAVASDVRLDETCSEDAPPKCQVVKSGARLRPMPFDGFTCNAKCSPGCKGNAYLGPGEFRIVIYSCGGKQKFVGPAFTLGKFEPKAPHSR